MAFRAQGQGHLQGQMSKLYQKYISRVQLYPFKVSMAILRSRFVFCTICLLIFLQFLNQKGVSIGYHGNIQANIQRTSGSKTAAIVRNRDLGCPVWCFEFSKWIIL